MRFVFKVLSTTTNSHNSPPNNVRKLPRFIVGRVVQGYASVFADYATHFCIYGFWNLIAKTRNWTEQDNLKLCKSVCKMRQRYRCYFLCYCDIILLKVLFNLEIKLDMIMWYLPVFCWLPLCLQVEHNNTKGTVDFLTLLRVAK